jgi:hypothetical protein
VSTSAELECTILADGTIDDSEVALVREEIDRHGPLDLEDVRLLVELYCGAHQRSAAFEDLFFEALDKVLLADGEIGPADQFYLLKMLYSDRMVTEREKQFLLTLQRKVKRCSAEFDALCEEALAAPATDWDVGGR